MEADLGYVHCASEAKAKRFFKFKFGDLHGRLEVWPKALKVDGKRGSRTFPNCRSVEPIFVRLPILGSLLIVFAILGGGWLAHHPPADLQAKGEAYARGYWHGYILGQVVVAGLAWLAIHFLFVFRWVRLRYVDPDGTPQTICFSKSNMLGGTYSHLPFGFSSFQKRIADEVKAIRAGSANTGPAADA